MQKMSGSSLVVNGKKIPLSNSKKSRRKKISSESKGVKKASSAVKKEEKRYAFSKNSKARILIKNLLKKRSSKDFRKPENA